jgi:hypothetical protein
MCSDENSYIKLIDEHSLIHFLALVAAVAVFFGHSSIAPRCRLKLSLYLDVRGLASSARASTV